MSLSTKTVRFFFTTLFIAFLALAANAAKADTYAIEHIGNGNDEEPVAVDDWGDYTINISFPALILGCNGVFVEPCFETVYNAAPLLGVTVTGPSPAQLFTDPHPTPGAGCAASVGPESMLSCVNGHPIYYVNGGGAGTDGFTYAGLYYGTSPADYIADSYTYDGSGVESANGNFAYLDGLTETVNLALDESTRAVGPLPVVTPEPDNIALFATSILGILGAIQFRKRKAKTP